MSLHEDTTQLDEISVKLAKKAIKKRDKQADNASDPSEYNTAIDKSENMQRMLFNKQAAKSKLKESIDTMIHQIATGDTDAARETMNYVLAQKVNAALENVKMDVANQYFNGIQKESKEVQE